MTPETPTALQQQIASEFERNGWTYDLITGRVLLAAIERSGVADAQALARAVPHDFLVRNDTTREAVADAIDRAVGGKSVQREAAQPATLVIKDHRYSINLGPGARIESSNVNVGGTQIVVDVNVDKGDVLAAAETLIRAGLAGQWDPTAAVELASVIEERSDVTVDEIRELTKEVVEAEKPTSERIKSFLADIAKNAIGGALGAGMSAGLGGFL
jgi:hypothetical protein